VSFNFAVAGAKYDRFMGRYLPTLGTAFADVAGVRAGMAVLDVGCGPGGLTQELVARVGADRVAAIDPSAPFVEACRARNPGADVREGVAEQLPFDDDAFDASLSSLVVAFMRDPVAGVREMARVTKQGGVVAACMWDSREGMTMLKRFWEGATAVDPDASGESNLIGTKEGELADLMVGAELSDVEVGSISARAEYESFDDWWEPFTFGIGPAGAYCVSLDDDRREAVREACRTALGDPTEPFALDARAWFARGRVA
jgi:Methylase involved in ubiquinone/menaquinone biosynthesis